MLVLGTMMLKCLQFTALGPDLATIRHFFDFLCAGISVNVEKLLELVNGVYWVVLDCTLGTVALWLIVLRVLLERETHGLRN